MKINLNLSMAAIFIASSNVSPAFTLASGYGAKAIVPVLHEPTCR
jgi:hypothetical protein